MHKTYKLQIFVHCLMHIYIVKSSNESKHTQFLKEFPFLRHKHSKYLFQLSEMFSILLLLLLSDVVSHQNFFMISNHNLVSWTQPLVISPLFSQLPWNQLFQISHLKLLVWHVSFCAQFIFNTLISDNNDYHRNSPSFWQIHVLLHVVLKFSLFSTQKFLPMLRQYQAIL